MLKKFLSLTSLSIFFLLTFAAQSWAAEGPQEDYLYYVIPVQSAVEINNEVISNDSRNAPMMKFQMEEEELKVDKETVGLRIFSNHFVADVNKEALLQLTEVITLNAGSIHVSTNPESTVKNEIKLGELTIRFQESEFLAFVSGDKTEMIIKVIDGEVEIESPSTQQTAILEAQQATNTDDEGRLLMPFPVEISSSKGWWNDSLYKASFEELPISDAGDDQRVLKNTLVSLDGSRSQFLTGDVFEWKLVKGPNGPNGVPIDKIAFNTINIVKPQFTPEIDGEYLFTLQITNQEGQKSNQSDVTVYVGSQYLKPSSIFPDVPSEHPNNLAITYLYKKNVMKGSEDPESGIYYFRPDDTINRVEILKTIFENLNSEIPSEEELQALDEEIFLDVKPDHWFAPYVYLAKERGIVKGNDGLYRPADKVLLVEALKIISEAAEISLDTYQDESTKPYPDTELKAWYNPYLFFVKKYNLFDTDSDGNIHPGKQLTRAEFAEIIYRIENSNLNEKRGFVSGKVLDATTKEGISNAEIFVYKAVEISGEGSNDGFLGKGDLYFKTSTKTGGSFNLSLPIHSKFYIEANTDENISTNKIIVEVKEDEIKNIELEIEQE